MSIVRLFEKNLSGIQPIEKKKKWKLLKNQTCPPMDLIHENKLESCGIVLLNKEGKGGRDEDEWPTAPSVAVVALVCCVSAGSSCE